MNDEQIEVRIKTADEVDAKCYPLPLSPQDLVEIYKQKESEEDFELWVNYAESREKLSAKHIIIYLANTNFKASFSAVDSDLITEYITSEFLVECPLLDRIVTNIIKHRLDHELTPVDKELYALFNEEQIFEYIKDNEKLVNDLIDTIAQTVPFALSKIYENMSDEFKEKELDLKGVVDEIKVLDKPVQCGPNIINIVTMGIDAFFLVLNRVGLKMEYNKSIFNDAPKYYAKDLFYMMNQTKFVNRIIEMMPIGFFVTIDVEPFVEETE